MIKNNCAKSNKGLINRKINIRVNKVIGTISNIFGHSLYSIIIDENKRLFIKGEELIANYKQIKLITDEEWKILKDNNLDEKNSNKEKKIKNLKNKKIKVEKINNN